MISSLGMDLRYATRLLRNAPGFTAVAIATLALGMGANTVVFTALEAFVLRPLSLPGAHELVYAQEIAAKTGETASVSYADFVDWKAAARAFDSFAALQIETFNVAGAGRSRRVRGARVSSEFFRVMGIAPLLGRTFLPEQDRVGTPPIVVLGNSFWKEQFAGSPEVVGKTFAIDGAIHTVVGVMPPELRFPGDFSEFWTPLAPLVAKQGRGDRSVIAVGRLRPGTPIGEVRAQLDTVARRLESSYPETNRGMGALAVPLEERLSRGPKQALIVLFVTVLFVLLICCANIANLLNARSLYREQEIAVRMAMGASSGNLLRQLLAESALLAVLGSGAGLIVASWGLAALEHVVPPSLMPMGGFEINLRVLAFCGVLTAFTTFLFGLAPSRRLLRRDIVDVLRRNTSGASGAGKLRTARVLVVAELTVSVVLVTNAGLLIGWMRNLQVANPGFRTDRVLTSEISTATERNRDTARQASAIREVLTRLENTPGVTAASAVNWPPMTNDSRCNFVIEGRPAGERQRLPQASYRVATPRYASVLGIAVLRGRFFAESDAAASEPVAVVNQRFARVNWPGDDPLGRHVAIVAPGGEPGPWATVVGVVADVHHVSPLAEPSPELYVPLAQHPQPSLYLALRTSGDPAAFTRTLEAVVRSVDPDMPLNLIRPMEEVVAAQQTPNRIVTEMMALFAMLAFALAGMGLYGVMSYLVAQRSQEFGIRLALGATPRRLLALVLRRAAFLAAFGALFGAVLALVAARVLAATFVGLRIEPAVFPVVAGLLAAVVLAASSLPLRRVLSGGPVQALRPQ
jgi:putative ABC transport system permease protein